MLDRYPPPSVECARAGCMFTRNRPCSSVCHLTTGAHFTAVEREAQRAADRRELAEQNIDDWKQGSTTTDDTA